MEADLTAAIARGQDDAVVYYNRGEARVKQGNWAGAEADLTAAIAHGQDDAVVYFWRGLARGSQGNWAGVEADLTAAIAHGQDDADVYFWRALARVNQDNWGGAEADFTAAIAHGQDDAEVYYNRGLVRSDQKKYKKALADYNKAIRLDPNDATAYCSRAWLWATCPETKYRDGKRAVESATRACELSDWKDTNDLDTLAAAYAETGDFDAAVKWQERALDLLPKDAEESRKDYGARLELYKAHKPYRDVPEAR